MANPNRSRSKHGADVSVFLTPLLWGGVTRVMRNPHGRDISGVYRFMDTWVKRDGR